MIVRISGEDQYRLADSDAAELNELDAAVVRAAESQDEAGFGVAYPALIEFVRTRGEVVPDDELEGSDLILPPADITLAEAGEEFTGEGLIPD
jgi:PspAA-like protein